MIPAQFVANLLLTTASVFLVGLSFAVVYRVVGFFHIAHGVIFTVAPYAALLAKVHFRLPLFPALLLGVAFAGLLGCLMEMAVYRTLRRRGASSLVFLLASLGLYVALQNLVSLFFGDETQSICPPVLRHVSSFGGMRLTLIQAVTLCTSGVVAVVLPALFRFTEVGRAMRAVANDTELASVSGVDSKRVILQSFALGSALVGLAGILYALDTDMAPTMGMTPLLLGIVAMIVGGANRIAGVILGAFLLAMGRHLAVWTVGSQWQEASAFLLLLMFLLLKPHGFLGKPSKRTTV